MLYFKYKSYYVLVILIGQDKHFSRQTFDAYPFFIVRYTPSFFVSPLFFFMKLTSGKINIYMYQIIYYVHINDSLTKD